MNIQEILIPTMIVRSGMHIRDVFSECGKLEVQSLPFCNEQGVLSGKLTIRNILKLSCLPEHFIELAGLLGNQLSCVENAEEKALEIICNPVDPYVSSLEQTITSDEPLIKAVAMMEKNNSNDIFVVDEGQYKGIVTIQAIAHKISKLGNYCS